MKRDRLYLLRNGFFDQGEGPFHCPSCLRIEGVLALYPPLRDQLEVVYVDFARPREAMAEVFGTEHPGCPTLQLVRADTPPPEAADLRQQNGIAPIVGADAIIRYLVCAYGISRPH